MKKRMLVDRDILVLLRVYTAVFREYIVSCSFCTCMFAPLCLYVSGNVNRCICSCRTIFVVAFMFVLLMLGSLFYLEYRLEQSFFVIVLRHLYIAWNNLASS